jgi:hypothetical protein
MKRRITPEGRLADYHPEVGRLWRSRHEEPEQEVFDSLPKWMLPLHEDRDARIDLERLIPAILETMTHREQVLLWCRFWGDYTLSEVGVCFGVTQERVRQIEAKALRRLRHPSRSAVLQTLFDFCPVQQRQEKLKVEEQRKWYAKWTEDCLIAKMIELRESTYKII